MLFNILSAFLIGIFLWVLHTKTSEFHVQMNKLPGSSFYLPVIGDAWQLFGSLDRN